MDAETVIAWLKANHLFGLVRTALYSLAAGVPVTFVYWASKRIYERWQKRHEPEKTPPEKPATPIVVHVPPPTETKRQLPPFAQERAQALRELAKRAATVAEEIRVYLSGGNLQSIEEKSSAERLALSSSIYSLRDYAVGSEHNMYFDATQRNQIQAWCSEYSELVRVMPAPRFDDPQREEKLDYLERAEPKRFERFKQLRSEIADTFRKWIDDVENPSPPEMPTIHVDTYGKKYNEHDRKRLGYLLELENDFDKIIQGAETYVRRLPGLDEDEAHSEVEQMLKWGTLPRQLANRDESRVLETDWVSHIIVWTDRIFLACGILEEKEVLEIIHEGADQQQRLAKLGEVRSEITATIKTWRNSIGR